MQLPTAPSGSSYSHFKTHLKCPLLREAWPVGAGARRYSCAYLQCIVNFSTTSLSLWEKGVPATQPPADSQPILPGRAFAGTQWMGQTEKVPKGLNPQGRGTPEPVLLNLMNALDSAQKRHEHVNFHQSFRGSRML